VRCRRCDHRLVLTETRQALFMELRIGNRTTLFAHARLAESAICFEKPIVTFALDDVLPGSIRMGGHRCDGRQASRREGQADRSFEDHDNHLRWGGYGNTREGVSVPHKARSFGAITESEPWQGISDQFLSCVPTGAAPKLVERNAHTLSQASEAAGSLYSNQRPFTRLPGWNQSTSNAWCTPG
jgi:hypothetical protein